MLSNKNLVVVSMLQYVTGSASSHIFKYYVKVIMYLVLVLYVGGLVVMKKSTAHLSKTYKVNFRFKGISSL
jgi:hypothetical protein